MAPFDVPVVPPVYWRTATSSALSGFSAAGPPGVRTKSPKRCTPSSSGMTRGQCPCFRRSRFFLIGYSCRNGVLRNSPTSHTTTLHAGVRLGLRHVVPEQVEGDDGLHSRVGPELLEFPRRVQGVRLHDDASGAEDPKECNDEVRGVREDQGHAVPATNADFSQACGKSVGCLVQFSIRD